jgi:hypothetical protein
VAVRPTADARSFLVQFGFWGGSPTADAERCNVFDIAYMLVTKDDSSLGPEMASRYSMVREALVREALDGSPLAHDALCYAATVLTNRDKDLPPWLGRYLTSLAAEGKAPSKRGAKPHTNSLRDTSIAWTAGVIAYRYGLKPTRSPATKEKGTTESGCSIVQEALAALRIGMQEENVNAIWQDMGPHDATRAARMEAVKAAYILRRDFWRLFASRPPAFGGDAEWLKEREPRETACAWRQRETHRHGKGTGRRKKRRSKVQSGQLGAAALNQSSEPSEPRGVNHPLAADADHAAERAPCWGVVDGKANARG